MALLKSHINFLISLKKRNTNFFSGDILTFGQQAVYSNLLDVYKIFNSHKLKPNIISGDFDMTNKIKSWENTKNKNNINAQSFFMLLGSNNLKVLDVSDYEDPDIIHDLNYKVSSDLHNKFNSIIDIGTLEHLFDIPIVFENIINMLKINGTYVCGVPSSNFIDHGFYSFSPTLFYDYFENNGCKVVECYLSTRSPYDYESPVTNFRYNFVGSQIPMSSNKGVEVLVCIKKIKQINKFKKPIQQFYKNSDNWKNPKNNVKYYTENNLIISFKEFIKKIIFLNIFPTFLINIIFNISRSKNLKKINKNFKI